MLNTKEIAIQTIIDKLKNLRGSMDEPGGLELPPIPLDKGELGYMAACYAIPPEGRNIYAGSGGLSTVTRILWPSESLPFHHFNPSGDRLSELATAGALIMAEMERLITQQIPQQL